jgi:hypothetical protein
VSAVTALRRALPPPRSPERQALAIETRDTHRDRIVNLQAAIQRIGYLWKVEESVTAAREGIEEARRADARAATDAAIANTPPPPSAIPAARAALQEAEDTLANFIATKATLEADIAALQANASFRDDAVARSIAAVLLAEGAPAVAALVAELEALHARMADRHLALRELTKVGGVTMKENGLYTDAGNVSLRFSSLPEYWNIARQSGPIAVAWAAAIEALKVDANAPLPGAA